MTDAGKVGYKPLYARVRELLTQRLIDGRWQPGALIPSEAELARELGVSQGTIRKALDEMTAAHLLVRRQGRGTFVAVPEDGRILFQFFRLSPDDGPRQLPDSRVLHRRSGRAGTAEAAALGLSPGATVHRVERLRVFGAAPILVETIVLPATRFAGIAALEELPNNLYRLFSERWGVTIAGARERLKAVPAVAADAGTLGVAEGAPLLEIHRIAFDLEDKPVELRLSRCLTATTHYAADLR
ncbi:MAG: GntR family transcriptional regulator [Rhodobacteraceae bacterium]|jgi:GntR family transcriptional regulator|nr:GntR family transcriptional regulator [Paracoccaceae bacterium]